MSDRALRGRLLAVRADHAAVAAICTDVYGNRIAATFRPAAATLPDSGHLAQVISRTLAAARVRDTDLLAAGIGTGESWTGPAEVERRRLAERFRCPVFVKPESTLAALAEATWGAGRDLPDFLMVSDDPLTTITYVENGRPGPPVRAGRASGLNGHPGLLRNAVPSTPEEPVQRSAWAVAALRIAPLLSAECLRTGAAAVVLSNRLALGRHHLVDHLRSRISDVLPTAGPKVLVSLVTGDPVLRSAIRQAGDDAGRPEHR